MTALSVGGDDKQRRNIQYARPPRKKNGTPPQRLLSTDLLPIRRRHVQRGGALSMEKGRIAALDAGRAIAVVGVVAVHLSFQFPNLPHSVALIARMGQYGVQFLFVIG